MTRSLTGLGAVIGRHAHKAGERWANETRSRIHRERRAAAGGWPGTMSEARALVAEHLLPALACEGIVTLTSVEREEAARRLYHSARALWLQCREKETP